MKRASYRPTGRASRSGGLSLPEVVICMAIIALIASYAMPTYHRQLMRGYRAEAVSALYRAQHYVEHRQREAMDAPDPAAADPSAGGLPLELAQSPAAGAAVYQLSLLGASAENGGYTVQADPAPHGPMRDDPACGSYQLDATGRRANLVDGGTTTERVASCWSG
jgi:type IV pilus assembly protein PilE